VGQIEILQGLLEEGEVTALVVLDEEFSDLAETNEALKHWSLLVYQSEEAQAVGIHVL